MKLPYRTTILLVNPSKEWGIKFSGQEKTTHKGSTNISLNYSNTLEKKKVLKEPNLLQKVKILSKVKMVSKIFHRTEEEQMVDSTFNIYCCFVSTFYVYRYCNNQFVNKQKKLLFLLLFLSSYRFIKNANS